jgi:hypothetical protein
LAQLVNIPESEVARLGDEERIRAHYSDELSINELLTLAEQLSQLAERWGKAPQPERDKFLRERDAVLAQGDRLASRPPTDVSPLLREELARARADWQRAREAIAWLS